MYGNLIWGSDKRIFYKSTKDMEDKDGTRYDLDEWCRQKALTDFPLYKTNMRCEPPNKDVREVESNQLFDPLRRKIPTVRNMMILASSGIPTVSDVTVQRDVEDYGKTDHKPDVIEEKDDGDGTVPIRSQLFPALWWSQDPYYKDDVYTTNVQWKHRISKTKHDEVLFEPGEPWALVDDIFRIMTQDTISLYDSNKFARDNIEVIQNQYDTIKKDMRNWGFFSSDS
jgi:hypothetical protein